MTTPLQIQFPDQSRLISRLAGAIRRSDKLSFLVGSALTASNKDTNEPGVLNVVEIISEIEKIFADTSDYVDYCVSIDACGSTAERYQCAMKFLSECHGQQELNRLIQRAVLGARNRSVISTFDARYEKLEEEINGWHLRPAVKALGDLIANFPETFSSPTLTTNFDPLLEISVRKAGQAAQAVFLPGDGQFDNVSGGNAHRIIHLHGYWHGSDTLHTPLQLKRSRPRLKGCLRDHLSKNTLVILGYGGWEDVFTKTLLELISEERSDIDIIWCFFEKNEEDILKKPVFGMVEPALQSRLMIYKGIDCHDMIPRLHRRALQEKEQEQALTAPRIIVIEKPSTIVAEHTQAAAVLTVSVNESDQISSELECASPPSVSTWVGRTDEIKQIRDSTASVIAITGMGGKENLCLHLSLLRMLAKRILLLNGIGET